MVEPTPNDRPVARRAAGGRRESLRRVLRALLVAAAAFIVVRMVWRPFDSVPELTKDQPPPELSESGIWLNTDGPLSLATLRGKVVFLQFGFLG
ncbi:MAG TPA: hypothetical protein VK116_18255 [Planctomycetota bacterium]|nr:hypothetical protein [Planctomycetota bacterium]